MRKEKTANLVEINGKKFHIMPFDAFDGGYATLFVLKKIVPLLKALDIGLDTLLDTKKEDAFSHLAELIGPMLDSISREELREFMEMCLSQVEILRAAGPMKLYAGGIFNDEEIGNSTKACMLLCYHAIRPLAADFFGGNGLDLGRLSKLIGNQSPAKTSTNGSTDQ